MVPFPTSQVSGSPTADTAETLEDATCTMGPCGKSRHAETTHGFSMNLTCVTGKIHEIHEKWEKCSSTSQKSMKNPLIWETLPFCWMEISGEWKASKGHAKNYSSFQWKFPTNHQRLKMARKKRKRNYEYNGFLYCVFRMLVGNILSTREFLSGSFCFFLLFFLLFFWQRRTKTNKNLKWLL